MSKPDATSVLRGILMDYQSEISGPDVDRGLDAVQRLQSAVVAAHNQWQQAERREKSLKEQLEAAQIENRFWRSQVGADPDEPLAIPIDGEAPPEAIELGRRLAERYGWASNPSSGDES